MLDYLFGRGARESREEGNLAVALLDPKLPTVSGVEVLKQLKTDPNPKTIPAVLTSSSTSRALKRYRCAQGAKRTC